MSETDLEAWMAEQRGKRRLKLMRRAAETSLERGAKRTLIDARALLGLLEQLGA